MRGPVAAVRSARAPLAAVDASEAAAAWSLRRPYSLLPQRWSSIAPTISHQPPWISSHVIGVLERTPARHGPLDTGRWIGAGELVLEPQQLAESLDVLPRDREHTQRHSGTLGPWIVLPVPR